MEKNHTLIFFGVIYQFAMNICELERSIIELHGGLGTPRSKWRFEVKDVT